MNRRDFVATFGAAVIGATAGCLGGESEKTTTTTDPTTTTPTTTQTASEEPPETTQQTTTTGTAAFDVRVQSVEPQDREVYDGEATVTVQVQNTGTAAGEHTATVALAHRYLDDHRFAETVTLSLQAGETRTVTLRADFRATGPYTLLLNAERVGVIDVERLSVNTGGGGGGPSQEPTDPTIDVVATGNATGK
jgi:hypothetical protein